MLSRSHQILQCVVCIIWIHDLQRVFLCKIHSRKSLTPLSHCQCNKVKSSRRKWKSQIPPFAKMHSLLFPIARITNCTRCRKIKKRRGKRCRRSDIFNWKFNFRCTTILNFNRESLGNWRFRNLKTQEIWNLKFGNL